MLYCTITSNWAKIWRNNYYDA